MLDDSLPMYKPVYAQALQLNAYSMYLSGEVEDPEAYITWLNQINTAEPEDMLTIRINSYGGSVASAIQLSSALKNTPAIVHTSIEGDCCSAATMIFLAGDSMSVAPGARFLIHNYSGGIYGKGHEIHAQAAFDLKWSLDLLESTYEHFLSKEEIASVANGNDMWMDSEEVIMRCEILKEQKEKENGVGKENEQVI